MSRLWIALAAVCTALPSVARADVPPYQPTEDACANVPDGGACNINLDYDNPSTSGQGYADGGSGACAGGGTCSVVLQDYLADGGADPNGSNYQPGSPVSCVFAHKCYQQQTCLQCVPGATSGTSGGTATGTTGGTTGASSSSSTGTSGSSGSGGGCSTAVAVAPWVLALLVPLTIRRRKR